MSAGELELEDQAAEIDGQRELASTVEHGRYRLFQAEDGLVLARAVDTCERCQGCGCGQQAEPLALPDPRRGRMHLVQWMAANANRGLLGAFSRVMSANGE